MRVQLHSDLHFEHLHPDSRGAYFDLLTEGSQGVDLLVLAGDITSARELYPQIVQFALKYREVLFVPGNHEYYGSDPHQVGGVLTALDALPNVSVGKNQEGVTKGGLRYFAGTSWFPQAPPELAARFSDFSAIQGLAPWCYDQNRLFRKGLEGAGDLDFVVSHHMPSFTLVPPRFRAPQFDPFNHFFANRFDDLIETKQPKVWFFGHTHDRTDRQLGTTRLLSNPKGYPTESEKDRGVWQPHCTVTF